MIATTKPRLSPTPDEMNLTYSSHGLAKEGWDVWSLILFTSASTVSGI